VFLKRRPSAFYGTGVAELLRLLHRNALVIGGGATNRGVETSVREAFSMDLDTVVVRECCWGGDAAAPRLQPRHLDEDVRARADPRPGAGHARVSGQRARAASHSAAGGRLGSRGRRL
jgi:hypothetical protein